MRFRDDASELFTFSAVVTAYQRVGGGAPGGEPPPGGGGASGAAATTTSLEGLTALMKFAVNPTLGTVTVSIVKLSP
jgi:hypothetical protein